jgi:hypothetical protein
MIQVRKQMKCRYPLYESLFTPDQGCNRVEIINAPVIHLFSLPG